MKTKIWYSVQNGGDGSADPVWMESKELAELDQDHMDEGWGEPCTGWLTIESDGPIKILDEVQTVESMIKKIEGDYDVGDSYYPVERMKALKELKQQKS